MDGGASSPATATPRKRIRFPAEILLIEIREDCGPLELTRRRRGRIPLRTTLSQIPLKSCGFPGAESARKRFFLRGGKPPLRKNQRPGATNRNLRFRLVGREATCLPFGQATFPPRRSPASIGSREGSHPLELSRGCSGGDFGFRRSRLVLLWTLFPTTRGVGRSAPLHPLGGRVREGCAPSRALLGGRRTEFFLDGQGRFCSLAFFIAVLAKDFVSDDAGVGRSAPLHPLG